MTTQIHHPTPADLLATIMELVSAMKAHRQFMSRIVPMAQWDATVAYAEGVIRAAAASGTVSRSDLEAALAQVDAVVWQLKETIRVLPPEVLPQ